MRALRRLIGLGISACIVLSGGISVAAAQVTACGDDRDFLNEARALAREGDLAGALHLYTCNLAVRPQNYEALVERMETAVLLGDYGRAAVDAGLIRSFVPTLLEARIAGYQDTLADNPDDIETMMLCMLTMWADGQDEAVIALADRLLDIDPQNVLGFVLRGSSYQYLGDLFYPASDFSNALMLAPMNPDVFSLIGSSYVQTGDGPNGYAALSQALMLDPADARSYYYRGLAYFTQGYSDDARIEYAASLNNDPMYFDAAFERGFSYLFEGDLQSAIQDFSRAIEINPYFDLAFIHRGAAREQFGIRAQANRDYRRYFNLYVDRYLDPVPITVGDSVVVSIESREAAILTLELAPGQVVNITSTTQGPLDSVLLVIPADDEDPLAGSDDQSFGRRDPLVTGFSLPDGGTVRILVTASEPDRSQAGDIEVLVTPG
jgi:tetratricopeptide (TPR) repeat protein